MLLTKSPSEPLSSRPAEEPSACERISELESELNSLSGQLGDTFEQLSLFHELSGSFDVTAGREAHCRVAMGKLADCFAARTLAVVLSDKVDRGGDDVGDEALVTTVFTWGEPLGEDLLLRINAEIGSGGPAVVNHALRVAPEMNRIATVPLENGGSVDSRLLVIGHSDGVEFGTVEIRLMQSVAMILDAHLTIQRQFSGMREMFEATVRSLVSAIDAKDPYTSGHSSRVSSMAESLARDLGLEPELVETTRMSALLHDIGKIGVSDAVLRKPGKLEPTEFDEIKMHPEQGYQILRGVRQFRDMLPGVRYHHESWDGVGYPHGLKAEEIPLIARIIAVADAFDAMTSTRPYRQGMPIEKVEAIFRDGRGKQWDAVIVDALLSDRDRMCDAIAQHA